MWTTVLAGVVLVLAAVPFLIFMLRRDRSRPVPPDAEAHSGANLTMSYGLTCEMFLELPLARRRLLEIELEQDPLGENTSPNADAQPDLEGGDGTAPIDETAVAASGGLARLTDEMRPGTFDYNSVFLSSCTKLGKDGHEYTLYEVAGGGRFQV